MIKAGLVPERTGGNFIIPLAFLKKDQAGTAEKDLIAEVVWPADGLPTAGISMDAGMEAVSNVAIVSGNKTTFR